MKRNLLTHIAAAAALTIAAGSAAAQASDPATGSQGPQGEARGHVAVDISALRGDLAQRMNMAESEVPSTIRLPVGQAAQLCGVPASELAPPQGAAAAACTATEASTELQVAVRRELDQRGSPTGSVPSGTTTGSATDPTTTGATTGTSPGTTTGSATAESTTGSAATGTTSGGASTDVSSGATTGSATSETTTGSATSETTTGSASTGSATAGTATGSTAADASSAGAATVAVDIGAIRDQLAQRLNVEPTRLPSTVRVGVDIAASACALPASQLTAAQPQGAPACSATQLSPELQSAVQQQLTGG